MISLYSGTPGSGKSLHLAEKLYNRLRFRNGVIIGNFGVRMDKIKGVKKSVYINVDNNRLTPSRLVKFGMDYQKYHGRVREGTFLLVIDESQMLFNSREWQQSNRGAWLSFFTQHRKLGFDIILISQFDRMLDRQVRCLIEYEYIHRKVNNYGIKGKILALLNGGSLFVCKQMWYPMRERLGAEFFKGKKKYFDIYDTFTLFEMPKG